MQESTKVINGTFGKLFHEGNWLTNVTGVQAMLDINYEDIPRAGTRMLGHKAMSISQSGTIKSYKVNYELQDAIMQITDNTKGAFITELHVRLDDPENKEVAGRTVRLIGVQFVNLPIIDYEVGSTVEEELQFVFDDIKFL